MAANISATGRSDDCGVCLKNKWIRLLRSNCKKKTNFAGDKNKSRDEIPIHQTPASPLGAGIYTSSTLRGGRDADGLCFAMSLKIFIRRLMEPFNG